jgi:hypothetical protein
MIKQLQRLPGKLRVSSANTSTHRLMSMVLKNKEIFLC